MPNIKSAKKRVLIGQVREARNKSNKTYLKTTLKNFDTAVTAGDKAGAEGAYKVAVRTVDRAVSQGLLHKNNAARKKSKLTHRLAAV